MNRPTHTSRLGFTLIELLVVITIAATLLALTFPMITAMRSNSSASSGINTVTIAVSAARRYATDPKNRFVNADIDPGNTDPNEPGLYSGVAAIFTPAGEIRLTKNTEGATYRVPSSTLYFLLERSGPNIYDPATIDVQSPGQPERELNGFADLGLDYILLGSDVGVVGITRDDTIISGAAQPPMLIPPPFAVWFDQNGYLISTGQNPVDGSINDYQFVYYDGDRNNNYEVTADRWPTGSYDPNDYDPNHSNFDSSINYDDAAGKYLLPFDRLEAVIGVFVYSKEAFQSDVDNSTLQPWDAGVGNAAENQKYWDWMKENGEMILFSRQTGMVMRNRDE